MQKVLESHEMAIIRLSRLSRGAGRFAVLPLIGPGSHMGFPMATPHWRGHETALAGNRTVCGTGSCPLKCLDALDVAKPTIACLRLLRPSKVRTRISRYRRSATGWKPCVSGLHGDAQAGNRHPSGCCWNGRSDLGCWSGKWIDDAQPILDQQSVVHVLSPQSRAPSDQRGRHDHRVIDR